MFKSIIVRVMGREYPLRVQAEDEPLTREIAALVDTRMRAFKEAHPTQPELTTAIITALALAEELYTMKKAQARASDGLERELHGLTERLAAALAGEEAPKSGPA